MSENKKNGLAKNGFEVWDNYISKKITQKILEKSKEFFDKNINLGPAVNIASLKSDELTTYGAARQEILKKNKNFYLHGNDFKKGTNFLRNLTNGISITDPLLNIQEIFEIVSDPLIVNYAKKYLNSKKIYLGFVKLRRFFSNNLPLFDTNYFHTDDNSSKILKCIVYLNDIRTANDGAFVYVKSSHKKSMSLGDNQKKIGTYARTDDQIAHFYGEDSIIPILGQAGTAIFADTLGYHKGLKPLSNDRYVLYINYVLEEEYNGKGLKQKISKNLLTNYNNDEELFKFFLRV